MAAMHTVPARLLEQLLPSPAKSPLPPDLGMGRPALEHPNDRRLPLGSRGESDAHLAGAPCGEVGAADRALRCDAQSGERFPCSYSAIPAVNRLFQHRDPSV